MEKAKFNQFIWLRNQLVIASQIFGRDERVFLVLMPTMSKKGWTTQSNPQGGWRCRSPLQKDLCDSIPLDLGQARDCICQVLLFAGKKEDVKFQQYVYVNFKLEDFIYLLEVMNSVFFDVFNNQPICSIL